MTYLSIGKVSKLKDISIKSLRYYDDLGILVPSYVNPKTKYRYYSESQLDILDAIQLFLSLDIPLKDLQQYINKDNPKENQINWDTMLTDCEAIAQQKILSIESAVETFKTHRIKQSLPIMNQYSLQKKFFSSQSPLLIIPITSQIQSIPNGKDILSLFVLGEKLKLQVDYPSGTLYIFNGICYDKYFFLHIIDSYSSSDICNMSSQYIAHLPNIDSLAINESCSVIQDVSLIFQNENWLENQDMIIEENVLPQSNAPHIKLEIFSMKANKIFSL